MFQLFPFLCNFSSILSRQEEICFVIDTCNPHIILGIETWLSEDLDNNELTSVRDDDIFCKYEFPSGAGGVMMAM